MGNWSIFQNTQGFKAGRGSFITNPFQPYWRCSGSYYKSSQKKWHIKGLVPHLVYAGLTHLQYVDDTILFMEYDDMSIINMKFTLYCFEWMTGLKINCHKSEVVVLGVNLSEQQRVANMMNCQVGDLPMKYVEIPIYL